MVPILIMAVFRGAGPIRGRRLFEARRLKRPGGICKKEFSSDDSNKNTIKSEMTVITPEDTGELQIILVS